MSSSSALTRAVAIVAVFGIFLAAGNALGKDDEPEPAREVARASAPALGPLRLEPAPALPDLRVQERRRRETAPESAPASGAPAAPRAHTGQADVEVQAPVTPVEPVTPTTPAPTSPSPTPPVESSPEPAGPPAPDPAPTPSPSPGPDPSPSGGSGQFSGGG